MMSGPRVYPLFMKGAVRYRFEYGVFLLNKNIELVSAKLGLRLLDIRQTLPNLKYLLFVATAGTGELPARKVGGVRGLLRQMSTPASSNSSAPTTVVVDGQGITDPESKLQDTTHALNGANGNPIRTSKAVHPRIGIVQDVT